MDDKTNVLGVLMKNIKVHFCDFWPLFNPSEWPLYKTLSLRFDLSFDSENPDIVFFSCFSGQNSRYNGKAKKVLFLGEHWIKPEYGSDLSTFDASLTHLCSTGDRISETSGKNYYFPLWVQFVNWFYESQPRQGDPDYFCDPDLFNGKKRRSFTAKDRKFCSLINNWDPSGNRKEVHDILMAKNHVDCYGSLFNNTGGKMGGTQSTKCELLKDYKFSIAFENLKHSGYNTEKIIQPIEAGCIPVYWGGERVRDYFNPKSYINVDDFNSMEEVVDEMLRIDSNDELFEEMVSTQPFTKDPVEFHPETILDWLCEELKL